MKNKSEKRKFLEPTLTKEASLVEGTLGIVLVSGGVIEANAPA